MEPPRVVLDTSVIVAGLRSRLGASNRLLELVAEERLVPLVTTALFLEYEEVLKRPEQRLATGYCASRSGTVSHPQGPSADGRGIPFPDRHRASPSRLQG